MRSSITPLLLLAALASHAQSPVGAAVPGRYLVTYRNSTIPADAALRATAAGARLLRRHDLLGVAVVQTQNPSSLALDPAVASVVQDRIVHAHSLSVSATTTTSTAADSLYNSPAGWATRAVGGFGAGATSRTPGPWNITQGYGVRIAILDSGVDVTHPDIAPNLALSLSEIDQSALPSACDDATANDHEGHGTWTASLTAGALGPTTGLIAGVAPQATILNIKVLERLPAAATAADPTGCINGQASGLLSWVIQGIEDAVANRANIISMSLGTLVDVTTGDGAGLQATFNHVTQAAFNAGTLIIAAAGNDGFSLVDQRFIELPAQSRDVLAIVAATNPACAENLTAGATCAAGPVTQPYYSNYGAPLNALAAPGGSYPDQPLGQTSGWITGACSASCFNLGNTPYVQAMGTSASAPLAAGAAALLLAANPTWTPTELTAALRRSAVTLPTLPVPQISATALLVPSAGAVTFIPATAKR